MPAIFRNRGILITGATGSLGGALLRTMLDDVANPPGMVRVFSRDESKQYRLRAALEKTYGTRAGVCEFMIGDVRNQRSLYEALADISIVIHAAALKHVPICERNTSEAIATNIMGAENLVRAVELRNGGAGGPGVPGRIGCPGRIERVVALSTDKACAPLSLMGMTKSIQERVFASAASRASAATRSSVVFCCIRMGNMIMSRGSIVPLFLDQISRGGPVTITDPRMTRYFITLKQAAAHVVTALEKAGPGQVYIPAMKAVNIVRLARGLCRGFRHEEDVPIRIIGIRPGEKLHDILVSRDETPWLIPGPAGGYLLRPQSEVPAETGGAVPFRDFSSADPEVQMSAEELSAMLDETVFAGRGVGEESWTQAPGENLDRAV